MADPLFNNTRLLLPLEGADGSTTFTDVSPLALTPSAVVGSPALSTTRAPYGASSLFLPASGNNYIDYTSESFRIFSMSSLAIEMSVYFDSLPTGSDRCLFDTRLVASNNNNNDGAYPFAEIRTVGALNFGIHGTFVQAFTTNGGIVVGRWYRFAFVFENDNFSGGTRRFHIFIDGVRAGTTMYAGGTSTYAVTSNRFRLGANFSGTGLNNTYIKDVRYTVGHPRYMGLEYSYDPDFLDTSFGYDAILGSQVTPRLAPGGAVPVGTFKRAEDSRKIVSYSSRGTGQIIGTVKEKGMPSNLPLVRKVRIFKDFDGILVDETWSDAAGNYVFQLLDRSQRYTVVAYDYAQNYRAVIADNLQPEPMP